MKSKRFQMMRRVLAQGTAALLAGAAPALLVIAAPTRAEDVLARFETGSVTRADVDQAIARQGVPANARNRTAALRAIVAAYAVVEQLAGGGKTLPPELDKAVADARRQVMLNYYLGKQIKQNKPEASAIDGFVRANPQFFGNRATFRQVRLLIDNGGKPLPDVVQAAIRQLQGGGRPTIAGINRLKAVLRGAQLPVAAQELYQSSEQIAPDQLRDLEAMAAGNQPVRLRAAGRASELVVLLDRIADPVDPADMRSQIANGLAAQDVQAQSQRLIDDIGAARIEELRTEAPENADVFNLTGKVDPALARRAEADDDQGSVLNLFGRPVASPDGNGAVGSGGAGGARHGTAALRHAALFLGLIGLLGPIAVIASAAAAAGFSRHARLRNRLLAATVTTLVVFAGFLTKARALIEPMGGRMFLSVLIGAGLAGCLAALVWGRSERARVMERQGTGPAEGARPGAAMAAAGLALATLALALWLA